MVSARDGVAAGDKPLVWSPGAIVRQLGNPVVTVNGIYRLPSLSRSTRALGVKTSRRDPMVIGYQTLAPSSQDRLVGVSATRGRRLGPLAYVCGNVDLTGYSLVHARQQGAVEVNLEILTVPAISRAG